MDTVEDIKHDQDVHISFAMTKLESIEAQAIKTNGRVTKNTDDIAVLDKETSNFTTKVTTIATLFASFITFTITKLLP